MNFKLKIILIITLLFPSYVISSPRIKIQILIPTSTLNTEPSEKLTSIFKRQPENVLFNLRKVIPKDKTQPIEHLINNIKIADPIPDKLGSVQEHYDFWKTQYLLELITSSIDKKQDVYISNNRFFLGELTKKFEGTILQKNFFNATINVTSDNLDSTVNIQSAIFLLALLLDANDRNELPAFKNYLIMSLDNTLIDIRKNKNPMEVKDVIEQISQMVSYIKSANLLQNSINKVP